MSNGVEKIPFLEKIGGISGALGIVGVGMSIFSAVKAGKQRREAAAKERAATARRMAVEANRQDIPDFQQDLANPYANLQVATQAAQMQAEQQDIALASTLDTLRATGASAGGATALARAAAQSKRGVAASIEQQEARNAQLRAQGELQTAQIRQRGQMTAFQAQEAREMTQLDREASLESSYNQQVAAYSGQSSLMTGRALAGGLSVAAKIFGGDEEKDSTGYDSNIYGGNINKTNNSTGNWWGNYWGNRERINSFGGVYGTGRREAEFLNTIMPGKQDYFKIN